MKNETVTFSGKESTKIDIDSIKNAIGLIQPPDPRAVHHFLHNCTEEDLDKIFGKEVDGDSVAPEQLRRYIGMQIRKERFVVVGEIWAMDKTGRVLQKFRI